ncbi:hypothetical protein ABXT00_03535 [Stenotrophomonas koreensis]|uniref:hypothetical protein n=1 Tax=Stenotrophomonas koreensis TaxID=266128 RepID=UPI00339303D3
MRARLFLLALVASLLTACSTGPVKRISPPQVSVAQLSVQADGQWQMDLRLQNFSSMAMRFEDLQLEVRSGDEVLARVQTNADLSVGAESADIHALSVQPTATGRVLAASALADARALPYQLSGKLQASPVDGRTREYPINFRSSLHPAPGLSGVLR